MLAISFLDDIERIASDGYDIEDNENIFDEGEFIHDSLYYVLQNTGNYFTNTDPDMYLTIKTSKEWCL